MSATDQELLRDYAQGGSEPAFAELAARYTDLVYSSAWRQVRQAQLAEEVVQRVFILLARKAAQLSANVILSGWLLRTTRFISMDTLKRECRRVKREQLAASLGAFDQDAPEEAVWQELFPVLDESLGRLEQKDREALALRFFEKRSLEQVGQALGVSEEAAKKRVARAVDRLRAMLSRKKIALPAVALTASLSTRAVQAAPAGLAEATTKAALAAVAVGAGGGVGAIWLANLFRLGRGQLATVGAVVLLAMLWQAVRLVSARREQSRAEATLAMLQQRRDGLIADQEEVANQLRRASNNLARIQVQPALPEILVAAGMSNLNARLFHWDDSVDYVRVPKMVMDWIAFDGKDKRHEEPGAGYDDPERILDHADGKASPTLLAALGLNDQEQAEAQRFCQDYFAAYRQFAQARSYLTNVAGLGLQDYFKSNADSRAWVTPSLEQEGSDWRSRFVEGLAGVIGKERSRIVLRQANDDGSLAKCFDRFGAEQFVIAVTPLTNGQCSLVSKRTLQGEMQGGRGFDAPFSTIMRPFDGTEADRVWQIIGRTIPESLGNYLSGWKASHPAVPDLRDPTMEMLEEYVRKWKSGSQPNESGDDEK